MSENYSVVIDNGSGCCKAGLSGEDKQRLAQLLRRIADNGITLILVEHDMSLVM